MLKKRLVCPISPEEMDEFEQTCTSIYINKLLKDDFHDQR